MCSPRHHSCTAIPLLLCSALFYSPVLASFYFDITDTTSFLHSLTYSLVCDICGGYQILLANWRPPSCTHSLTDSLVCDIYDGGYQILLANRRPASYTHSLTHSLTHTLVCDIYAGYQILLTNRRPPSYTD